MASTARFALGAKSKVVLTKYKPTHSCVFITTTISIGQKNDTDDYKERSIRLGLASKETISKVANHAMFLDVRGPDELEKNKLQDYNFVNIPCTLKDNKKIIQDAPRLLPNKNG